MNNLQTSYYDPFFSHIYIEREIKDHPVTQRILRKFSNSVVIEIDHYKDIFCRSHQNYSLQKQATSLILAKKKQNFVYEGAPVCQNFGNRHFYYTSSVMNCIYDCAYCYLQGMYPSANIVVFVNLDEIMEQVEQLLEKHPVYLCVSYDTDLLALESIIGYTKEWIAFAGKHPSLTIEIRTKSAYRKFFEQIAPMENVIFAWTLSPENIAKNLERHVPTLQKRLVCVQDAIQKGFPVRLCFDPILYWPDWKEQYQEMLDTVFQIIRGEQLKDVSIGVFRISKDYMKRMRKQAKRSAVIQFPYDNDNGVYHYSKELTDEMITFVTQRLVKELSENCIFIWKESVDSDE